ncbi:unnamed protein product [Macrosiphum euphorbiae]|uniref:Transmembrane protein n=1 Tax=Macrosiphum euphorbiae TaxID=13131 RepID=A0AAV0XZ69_9HEMI|nr:unnamed protein product [Macrosiphum euphorbiae]
MNLWKKECLKNATQYNLLFFFLSNLIMNWKMHCMKKSLNKQKGNNIIHFDIVQQIIIDHTESTQLNNIIMLGCQNMLMFIGYLSLRISW